MSVPDPWSDEFGTFRGRFTSEDHSLRGSRTGVSSCSDIVSNDRTPQRRAPSNTRSLTRTLLTGIQGCSSAFSPNLEITFTRIPCFLDHAFTIGMLRKLLYCSFSLCFGGGGEIAQYDNTFNTNARNISELCWF